MDNVWPFLQKLLTVCGLLYLPPKLITEWGSRARRWFRVLADLHAGGRFLNRAATRHRPGHRRSSMRMVMTREGYSYAYVDPE